MTTTPAQLDPLIARIEAHQKATGLSDERFVARYQRHLGSTRSWRQRLCARDFTGLDLPKWLGKLNAFVTELEHGSPPAVYYSDLPFSRTMSALCARLAGQTNDRRCLVCLGPTGVGKSTWARAEVASSAGASVYVHALPTWRENRAQICSGLARALCAPEHTSGARGLASVLDALKAHPRTIIIDDAHEGGIELMRTAKTIIDQTAARIVLLCYPTNWDKVRSSSGDAIAEANQLFGRTLKPVFEARAGSSDQDIAAFLRSGAQLNGDAKALATRIGPVVRANGNLRVLEDALEDAAAEADDRNLTLSASTELIVTALQTLCPTRS